MYLPREPSLVARPICGQHETASVAACNSQLLPTNQICELLSYPKKTKNPNPSPIGNRFGFFLFGGRGWIRTTEAESSRFTVCPHWPLGNTPIFTFCVLRRTTCLFYHAERLLSTVFLPFSSNAFSVQRNGRKSPAAMQARQSRRKKPAGRN